MNDTYDKIWNRVLLHCPSAGQHLARHWVESAFRRVCERREWSWRIKHSQWVAPALYNTGTVSVSQGSQTVTGLGTSWTTNMIGRQFRIGVNAPIYTIVSVDGATSLTLDLFWAGPDQVDKTYEIYQCYFEAPYDFHHLICIWDPRMNWQLYTNLTTSELASFDSQRSFRGQAYVAVNFDYSPSYVGSVAQPIKVIQGVVTGDNPISAGPFTGPVSSLYTVKCESTGISGVATFGWNKNNGTWTSGLLTSNLSTPLIDGVQVAWPDDASQTYRIGDTWVITTSASSNPGLPRYELWPHQTGAYYYPFMYIAQMPDIDDEGVVLPRYLRGDVLIEMALAEAAKWPGLEDKPNPYFNLGLSKFHTDRAEFLIRELEVQDDNIYEQNLTYATSGMSMAPLPWGDAAWLAKHSL
jgi:hypothetical protein